VSENPDEPQREDPDEPQGEDAEAPQREDPDEPQGEDPDEPQRENPDAPQGENPDAQPKDADEPQRQDPDAPQGENPEAPQRQDTEAPQRQDTATKKRKDPGVIKRALGRTVNHRTGYDVPVDVAGRNIASRRGTQGPVSDEALVRTLYAEHAGPLLRYALHLTNGDRQRAEDIVQETLLRGWLHPEAIAERPARPWLFAVARNLAVDAYRARRARPHEVGEAALELIAAPDEADRALESWAVADALKALRPEHRGVLLETYYRGRSVAEAAVALGIPAGTVKSRTFYALRALKLALEERGLAP
jgi:RNA polymerase sigma-70 factor (ECF subfamily)